MGRPTWRLGLASTALLLLVILPAVSGAVQVPGGAPHPPAAQLRLDPLSSPWARTPSHPPVFGPIRPASTEFWYTQVGATLAEENGSVSAGQLTELVESVTLVTSPYPIGYELNGLSSTGDWYQVLITDNWAGCNSGFEMTYEVWDNTGGAQSPVCDPTLTLNAGDSVKLSLSFPSSSMACLDATDLTTTSQEHDCVSQPDTGANGFQLLSQASNGNGYFSGPMTEIANPVPTSCPDYTNMPVVDYRWPSAYHVEGYFPFSDEFETISGSTVSLCYSSAESEAVIPAGDPTTHFIDTASGTGDGPHVVAGQNFTYLVPADGWRLVTDPVPLTGVTVSPTSGTFIEGTVLQLNATVTGGTSPYNALWSVNGTFLGLEGVRYNWTVLGSGTYTIDAYGVDARELVVGPAAAVITVPGVLSAGPISADTPSDGADVGQVIVLSSHVAGGFPPYQFEWSGLPGGCTPNDASSLPCTPSLAGMYTVSLLVIDTNGTHLSAPELALEVSSAFSGTASVSRTSADVGQTFYANVSTTGGAAPFRYTWSGIPGGCDAGNGPSVSCAPPLATRATFAVTASDANGVQVNLTPGSVTVLADPVASFHASQAEVDLGVSDSLTAQASAGLAPYGYSWSGLPAGCVPASVGYLATCEFPLGSTVVGLNVSDANGFTVAAPVVVVSGFPALTATVTGGGNVSLGSSFTLAVVPVGGAGSNTFTWQNLPLGCSPPSGGTLTCSPGQPGEYNITVVLHDTLGGGRDSVVATVNVTASSGGSGPASPVPWLLIGVLSAVGVVGVGLAVVLARRRRA